ncbi:MAG: dTDP-4-amino-4,6-dideoxygalactose transaminase [bacterium]
MQIPFNIPYLTGKEEKYINDVLQKRKLSGDGYYTKKVTSLLKSKFSLNTILMTTSCTHALEMAVDLIDLKEGEEVIMPSFTFPSTANAVVTRGGRPIFAEIKKDTMNINPEDIERKVTEKTRAIIPVHYAGISCEMDEIKNIAERYRLYIIEDAAQGVNARYREQYLGGLGDFACFSFHDSKNYLCGEGGALVINSSSENIKKRAEIIREKGTNRSSFLRGEVSKYTWVDKGSSYLPSDLLMAVLYAQLKEMDQIKKMRKKIYEKYRKRLKEFLIYNFIDNISYVPENRESNYHTFYIKFTEGKVRNRVMDILKRRGITTTFHYIPLHSSPMGKNLGYRAEDLKITNEVGNTILRLPLYPDLTDKEQEYIIENIADVFKGL